MTALRRSITATLALAALSALTAACTVSATGPTGSDPSTGTLQTEPSSAGMPSASVSIEPSTEPSKSAVPSQPAVTEPPIPEPPAATIAVEGGDPVVGVLGSYAWMNAGSDSPWIPGAPIHVGRGERFTFKLADPVRLANWTVGRTPAATVGSGVVEMGEGASQSPTFAAPPPGSWSINVTVWFADNLGSAAYYWLISVD